MKVKNFKKVSIYFLILVLLALTGCTAQETEDVANLEAKYKQETNDLKEKYELRIKNLKREKDTYKTFIDETIKYLNDDELLELAKSEWSYNVEVNEEPVPPSGVININKNDFEIVYSEQQSSFPSLPQEIYKQGRISGEYIDHLLIKEVEPVDVARLDGTVVTGFKYVFKNIPSNTSIKIEISDELKERMGLKTNTITVDVNNPNN